jgi:hypothetical protein
LRQSIGQQEQTTEGGNRVGNIVLIHNKYS